MSEAGRIVFGTTTIAYEVRRSAARKTISIAVDAGGVLVSAPAATAPARLEEVVRQRAAWIVGKMALLAQLQVSAEPAREFVSGESVRYLGRQYRLKVLQDAASVRLRGRYLEVPAGEGEEYARAQLVAWYRRQAQQRLPERVALYARRLGMATPPVLVRDQRKRWGSCSRKGELRFNWRVILAPMALVDYVVAHELVHLEHMDHSPAFWRRLGQVMPNYAELQERLDRLGRSFDL